MQTVNAAETCCVFFWYAGLFLVGRQDWKTMTIPDRLQIYLLLAGIVNGILRPEMSAADMAAGMLVISFPLYLISRAVPEMIGGGDIKLTGVCGIFLGWEKMIISFALAVFLSGIYGTVLMMRKRKGAGEHIAFGTFLCAGAMVSGLL